MSGEIYTPDKLEYQFFPLDKFEVTLSVKAAHDAHIALASDTSPESQIVEIFLGGWEGTKSAIRLNREKPDKAELETPDIVTDGEERTFVVRWSTDGTVQVFLQDATEPFLQFQNSEPFPINFFGVRTAWGASGSWRVDGVKELTTADSTDYTFFPVHGGSLVVDVRAKSNAHIALSSGPSDAAPIEIFLGGWDNTKSVIRVVEKPEKAEAATEAILDENDNRRFIIKWGYGGLEVKRDGQDEAFLSWANPEPTPVTHFGVRTGWGAEGFWLIQGVDGGADGRPKRDTAAAPSESVSAPVTLDGVSWVAASNGEVPEGSLVGGDDNGEPIVVARGTFEGELLPGKLIAAHGVCYLPWGGEEHTVDTYETLVVPADAVSWVASGNGEILPNAIPGGTSLDGETLYIGRVGHEGTITTGKLHPSHATLYISYGGAEIGYPEYEILVLN